MGTTFEQAMTYPQKQITIESCSCPAELFAEARTQGLASAK
jgi:hypothetical protein